MRIPPFCSRSVKARLENCAPWSVLKILRLPLAQCLLERLQTKRHVHRDRHAPGQDIPAEPIHHGHQIHIPRCQADRGNVRTPHRVDPSHEDPAQQVRVDRVALRGLTEPRLHVDGFQPHLPQQPPNALVVDRITLAPQPGRHPANPIKRRGCVRLIEHPQQLQMLGALLYGLIVPAPPRQPQQRAWPTEADLGMARLNQFPLPLNGEGPLFFSASPARRSTDQSAGIRPTSGHPPPWTSPHAGGKRSWATPLTPIASIE